jgi:hypothetical protein
MPATSPKQTRRQAAAIRLQPFCRRLCACEFVFLQLSVNAFLVFCILRLFPKPRLKTPGAGAAPEEWFQHERDGE